MNIKINNIKQPEGGLLQSHDWTTVLRSEGKNVLTLADAGDVGLHCILNKLPIIGMYTYVPRACTMTSEKLDELLQKTKKCSAKWMRLDICDNQILALLDKKEVQYTKAPHDMQPKENLIINIDLSEEDLLAQMKSKTRYNIRLAQKKEVKIFTTHEQKYIDIFVDLVQETAKRKNVSFHERDHYNKIFEKISDDKITLFVAEYNGEVIAANIISFYGGVATYLHGATSDKYRNVMAPFLLQWEAIKKAKLKHYRWYDLGGIFPNSEDAGKKGITRFKTGFSPKTLSFKTLGSYDVIFSNSRYKLYRFIQKIRR